ncbi:hypothetical protein ACFYNZ_09290 [Streptomyces kebangsaanensis]|uniref:MFS transporter n=1 Tax=Streptomyces kebangsaanensis TaxID=864058 RepID=A0ABW6KTD2_9ACTN
MTAPATGIIGVGVDVIMYLVSEELLREAYEHDTGPAEFAVLLAGFLPFPCAGTAVGRPSVRGDAGVPAAGAPACCSAPPG